VNAAVAVAPPPGEVAHRGLITLCVILASVMQALDNTIANVALPRIQGSLSSTQDQMSWVLTSYIIAAAIMTPLSGWLAGRYGRRRLFIYSVVGFTITSALCGIAQSLPEIVIARLLQGLSGAALIPMSQAVLLDINPPERHARAMALWIMAITVGPILGPVLGGWLTEHYSWRWVFFINVPVGVLAYLGIVAYMPETTRRKGSFDFFGFAALSLGIGALQMMLDRGQLLDWFSATEIRIEALIACLGLYLFIIHTLTSREHPFVSPALFRDRNFVTGNLFIFVVGLVLFATLALLPPMLQSLLEYPVVLTGLITAPRGVGMLLTMFVVNRMAKVLDSRIIIGIGFSLTAVSLWQMSGFTLNMDYWPIVWSGFLQGIGTGLVFVPLTATTFATLPTQYRNEGTALFSLMRNIGSSIGISVVFALLTRNVQVLHAQLAEHITPYSQALQMQSPQALATVHGLLGLNGLINHQAEMIAYTNDFRLMMFLTLCALPLIGLMRGSQRPAGKSAEIVVME
jgi:DHA2 family multidrug resistance protein